MKKIIMGYYAGPFRQWDPPGVPLSRSFHSNKILKGLIYAVSLPLQVDFQHTRKQYLINKHLKIIIMETTIYTNEAAAVAKVATAANTTSTTNQNAAKVYARLTPAEEISTAAALIGKKPAAANVVLLSDYNAENTTSK